MPTSGRSHKVRSVGAMSKTILVVYAGSRPAVFVPGAGLLEKGAPVKLPEALAESLIKSGLCKRATDLKKSEVDK